MATRYPLRWGTSRSAQLLLALGGLLVVKGGRLAGGLHLAVELGSPLGVLLGRVGVLLGRHLVLLGLAAVKLGLTTQVTRARDVGLGLVAMRGRLAGEPPALDLTLRGAAPEESDRREDQDDRSDHDDDYQRG